MHIIHKDQTISFFIFSTAYSMAPSGKQFFNLLTRWNQPYRFFDLKQRIFEDYEKQAN